MRLVNFEIDGGARLGNADPSNIVGRRVNFLSEGSPRGRRRLSKPVVQEEIVLMEPDETNLSAVRAGL